MGFTIRVASTDDLDGITRLTTANRDRLATWSPRWWRPSANADQIHPSWLKHLVEADGPLVRVVDEDGQLVGCVASTRQPHTWFVDDFAVVADERWPDVGTALVDAITERPALTCAATGDKARTAALGAVGLRHLSDYWIRETSAQEHPNLHPIHEGRPVPDPPPHTFGGRFDPYAEGALAFSAGAGIVVGSPSVHAPPVYDPGGTVCVIDRLVNADDKLIQTAIAAAASRGDVLIAIVASTTDDGLRQLLRKAGFERTVDVYQWP